MPSFLRRIRRIRQSSKPEPSSKDTSSLKVFTYIALSDPTKEFRLLTLQPATDDSKDIRCTLQHADLSNPGAFEAFSYTWGEQTDKYTIYINDLNFEVSCNLRHALENLRNVGAPCSVARVLWIDAICIDQKNIPERNEQVTKDGRRLQECQSSGRMAGKVYGARRFLGKL
ncbi:hypothetical protein ONS95_000289 [Cadophora gregata]|uniref:uncharacterized protein n=1 Tax=Cadophora gregata TaxID=51156 RepID=UPI0026DB406A|nr:uncharacterized protein ONS95_000289 [Cadophora gregata]KAK0125709.1 hypothetical protein ONS96_009541 [Cadophora gregata f. sp. sojae]KAK0128314.1 hypothetical protein ONS95_000289 [Cadophora gregata]